MQVLMRVILLMSVLSPTILSVASISILACSLGFHAITFERG